MSEPIKTVNHNTLSPIRREEYAKLLKTIHLHLRLFGVGGEPETSLLLAATQLQEALSETSIDSSPD